jgi:hypothetical protein
MPRPNKDSHLSNVQWRMKLVVLEALEDPEDLGASMICSKTRT